MSENSNVDTNEDEKKHGGNDWDHHSTSSTLFLVIVVFPLSTSQRTSQQSQVRPARKTIYTVGVSCPTNWHHSRSNSAAGLPLSFQHSIRPTELNKNKQEGQHENWSRKVRHKAK